MPAQQILMHTEVLGNIPLNHLKSKACPEELSCLVERIRRVETERSGLRVAEERTVWLPCLDFQCLQVPLGMEKCSLGRGSLEFLYVASWGKAFFYFWLSHCLNKHHPDSRSYYPYLGNP